MVSHALERLGRHRRGRVLGRGRQVIWINILLSGDNAMVIAHGLPRPAAPAAGLGHDPRRRRRGAVAHRFHGRCRLADDAALSENRRRRSRCSTSPPSCWSPTIRTTARPEAVEHLWRAVRIVAVADIIMSLDNVIAIAAAAGGNMALLVLGLAVSIPVDRGRRRVDHGAARSFPVLVWAGAALLGWIAGEVIATDPVVAGYLVHAYGASVRRWWNTRLRQPAPCWCLWAAGSGGGRSKRMRAASSEIG